MKELGRSWGCFSLRSLYTGCAFLPLTSILSCKHALPSAVAIFQQWEGWRTDGMFGCWEVYTLVKPRISENPALSLWHMDHWLGAKISGQFQQYTEALGYLLSPLLRCVNHACTIKILPWQETRSQTSCKHILSPLEMIEGLVPQTATSHVNDCVAINQEPLSHWQVNDWAPCKGWKKVYKFGKVVS